MAAYGFVAGLPLPLSGFTFRLWLSEGGVSLALIGLTANIGLAYSLKFLWSPILDNASPPGPLRRLGRRRGWLAAIQPALTAAAALLALSDPARLPFVSLALAALVAFLSASQDIVVDAWRIECLRPAPPGRRDGRLHLGLSRRTADRDHRRDLRRQRRRLARRAARRGGADRLRTDRHPAGARSRRQPSAPSSRPASPPASPTR